MSKEFREDKFTTHDGDFKVNLPQCSNCIHNISYTECEVLGFRPRQYSRNELECPAKETKQTE